MAAPEAELSPRKLRRAREEAFRLVFQADQGVVGFDDLVATEGPQTELPTALFVWASDLAAGAWGQRRAIDRRLEAVATGWPIDRMPSADRAILRLAVYEMLYRDDIPTAVTINEAVELAKRYGTDESPRFVNGVLGQLARQSAGEPEAAEAPETP